jgi:hypothetical protein
MVGAFQAASCYNATAELAERMVMKVQDGVIEGDIVRFKGASVYVLAEFVPLLIK